MAFSKHHLTGSAGEFSDWLHPESQGLQIQSGYFFLLLFQQKVEEDEEDEEAEETTASAVNISSRKSRCGFLIAAPSFCGFFLHRRRSAALRGHTLAENNGAARESSASA